MKVRVMPKTALTFDETGRLVVPTGGVEWDGWVLATRTRNHVLGDALLDWLDRYGEMKGVREGHARSPDRYLGCVFRKGREFELRVADHLRHLLPDGVRTIVSPDASLSQTVSLAMRRNPLGRRCGGHDETLSIRVCCGMPATG